MVCKRSAGLLKLFALYPDHWAQTATHNLNNPVPLFNLEKNYYEK
jgi:hypothetical protein